MMVTQQWAWESSAAMGKELFQPVDKAYGEAIQVQSTTYHPVTLDKSQGQAIPNHSPCFLIQYLSFHLKTFGERVPSRISSKMVFRK